MSPLRRLFKNIGMLLFAKGFSTILSIAIVSLIARYLSLELFGKYSFAMDFIFIFDPLAKFGLSQIIVREISRNKKNVAKDIFIVSYLRVFIILLCALLITLIVNNLPLTLEVKVAVYLAMISEFLFTFVLLYTDVFVAYERIKYVAILTIANRLIVLLGTLAVVYFDSGFYSLFFVLIAVNLLSTIVGFYITCAKFIVPQISFDISRIKYFLKEGYPIAIAGFLMQLSFRMDTFFLKALTNFNEVAFFGVPLRVVTQLLIISFAITEVMLPVFSRIEHSSPADLLVVSGKALKFIIIILLPLCVLLAIFAKEVITIIFGEKFIPSTPSMQLFMGVFLFFSLIIFLSNILISINKQNLLIFTMLIGICINSFCDILLIPGYSHVGASLGKFVAFGAMTLIIFYFVVRNLGPFPIYANILKPLLNVLPLLIIVYLLKDFNPALTIVSAALAYGISLFISKTFSFNELASLRQIIQKDRL